MKIVINACFGGFSISLEAAKHMAAAGSAHAAKSVAAYNETLEAFEYYKQHGISKEGRRDMENKFFDINIKYHTLPKYYGRDFDRDDPFLVKAVEELGEAADGEHAKLKVVEVPNGVNWSIDEYDGMEHVAEAHRTWA